MNEEHELEKLVIKNLNIIEQSNKILYDRIDPDFRSKLNGLMKLAFKKYFPEWELSLEPRDKRKDSYLFQFYPQEWCFGKKRGAFCHFNVPDKDRGDLYIDADLAYCTKVEDVPLGIWFCANEEFKKKFSPDFEKAICDLYVNNKARLNDAGFEFRDDALYRPFQLELATISKDWPNLTPDSIRPLLDALESVREVTPLFDGLVKRLARQA